MDWTTIVVTFIGGMVTLLSIVLPITLNRSHRKTRESASKGYKDINSRIEKVEISVNNLCAEVKGTSTKTQGLHLLDVIEHRPHCWETIRQTFASYQSDGGNGHVERVYRKWEEDYGVYYDAGEIPPVLMKKKRANNKTQE